MKYIIGIDLGGMSAKGGLFSENGELLTEEKVATCSTNGFERTLEQLANLSRVLVEKSVWTMKMFWLSELVRLG